MWNEVDLIWGKKESDMLVLQLSQERNESVVCGMCECVRRQWKMAGNKHFWHTGAPIHIPLEGFLRISHILIPTCPHFTEQSPPVRVSSLNFQQVKDFYSDISNVCVK